MEPAKHRESLVRLRRFFGLKVHSVISRSTAKPTTRCRSHRSRFRSGGISERGSGYLFDALPSREPASTSLENALSSRTSLHCWRSTIVLFTSRLTESFSQICDRPYSSSDTCCGEYPTDRIRLTRCAPPRRYRIVVTMARITGATTNSAAYAISPSRFRQDAIGKLTPSLTRRRSVLRTHHRYLTVMSTDFRHSRHTIISISAIRTLPAAAGYGAPLSCHPGDRSRYLLTNRPKLTYMSGQSVA